MSSNIPPMVPLSELSFYDKIPLFTHNLLKFFYFLNENSRTPFTLTKKFFLTLATEAQLLEDMLDFHGAKNNDEWFLFREFCASTYHLSMAAYYHLHLLSRFSCTQCTDRKVQPILKNSLRVEEFFRTSLLKLSLPILKEAKKLKLPVPKTPLDPSLFHTTMTRDRLLYDIDDIDHDQQKTYISKIASDFLKIAQDIEQLAFRCEAQKDVTLLVPAHINETIIWQFENNLHNLQSIFDTYVVAGGYRHAKQVLLNFRKALSMVIHLFQIAGKLLHLYERHLLTATTKSAYQKVQKKLQKIILPDRLLNVAVRYGVGTACQIVLESRSLANDILNMYVETGEIEVPIPKNMGFHSRPSLMVARIVQHYGGTVTLCVGEDQFDAASVLDIQWAGGKIQKEKIETVIFRGDRRTLHDLKILANVNYGEDLMGKGILLPNELSYLK